MVESRIGQDVLALTKISRKDQRTIIGRLADGQVCLFDWPGGEKMAAVREGSWVLSRVIREGRGRNWVLGRPYVAFRSRITDGESESDSDLLAELWDDAYVGPGSPRGNLFATSVAKWLEKFYRTITKRSSRPVWFEILRSEPGVDRKKEYIIYRSIPFPTAPCATSSASAGTPEGSGRKFPRPFEPRPDPHPTGMGSSYHSGGQPQNERDLPG